MKHDHLAWLREDGVRTKHRPKGKHIGYHLIRAKGRRPVTDANFETVSNCAICYPVKKHELTDNRRTA